MLSKDMADNHTAVYNALKGPVMPYIIPWDANVVYRYDLSPYELSFFVFGNVDQRRREVKRANFEDGKCVEDSVPHLVIMGFFQLDSNDWHLRQSNRRIVRFQDGSSIKALHHVIYNARRRHYAI